MRQLTELLDLSDVTNEKHLMERLSAISFSLMHRHRLQYGSLSWDITAIEFYLNIDTPEFVFKDPFIHLNPLQKSRGKFYVHDDGSRAANYSGIDITCGSGISHGGILIRELNRNDGSATAVKSIIRQKPLAEYIRTDKWNDLEKRSLMAIHTSDIFEGPLRLVESEPELKPELFRGKRILSITPAKAAEKSVLEREFIEKKLRYAVWETADHKKTMEKVSDQF